MVSAAYLACSDAQLEMRLIRSRCMGGHGSPLKAIVVLYGMEDLVRPKLSSHTGSCTDGCTDAECFTGVSLAERLPRERGGRRADHHVQPVCRVSHRRQHE